MRRLGNLKHAALLLAFALLITACGGGGQGGGSQQQYTFDYANVLQSGALFVAVGDGVKSAAATSGIKLKYYDNQYPSAETALRNARLMVQDKPDVIIDYQAVAGIGDSVAKMFNNAKIPCIAVNVPMNGCSWFNLVNREIGTDTAKVVLPVLQSKGWSGSDTIVLFLQSASAGTEVNDCIRYFYVTLSQSLPGFTVAQPSDITASTTRIGGSGWQLEGGGKLDQSYTAVKNTLQTIPADKHIVLYSINDDSVLGGWRAITEAHREANSLVAGLGSDEQSRQQLRTNPQWVAEGELFPSMWGEYLMAMGVATLKGHKPPKLTKTPQVVMTKDTVSKYFKPGSDQPIALPPLSPEDQYLKDAGILQKFHNIQGLS
ncbi:MAG: substrate-binding domain-containing protein [Actinomycetota bacterium]|nr:substrate-binding domain-containing protein [Candidatus Dormibacteraeota bacterium]MDQ6945241.1 substrate-binding domain-containing protein [Actinomycetota bacterium]